MEETERQTTESFEPGTTARERISAKGTPHLMRAIFGIFMVVIYVGMGVLLCINFFGWKESWTWARIAAGVLLALYGFWRAYRQIYNIDSPY
jgi:cytochrome c biogenesis protein CcdA